MVLVVCLALLYLSHHLPTLQAHADLRRLAFGVGQNRPLSASWGHVWWLRELMNHDLTRLARWFLRPELLRLSIFWVPLLLTFTDTG
jgi:hypothetical protein